MSTDTLWLRESRFTAPGLRMQCFRHAGAGAAVYLAWAAQLAPAVASRVAEWQHETTGSFFLHSSADALFDHICADLPKPAVTGRWRGGVRLGAGEVHSYIADTLRDFIT